MRDAGTESGTRSAQQWIWPLLCVLMAVGVIYLSYQNLQLKKQLAAVADYYLVPKELGALPVGQTANPFQVYLPDGQGFTMRTDSLSAPLVFAWFSPDCEPCIAARDNWNRLAASFPGQVWGISKAPEYTVDPAFSPAVADFPILRPASDSVFAAYGINATPVTMVITEDGTVGGVWHGPLTAAAFDEITSLLGQSYSERR